MYVHFALLCLRHHAGQPTLCKLFQSLLCTALSSSRQRLRHHVSNPSPLPPPLRCAFQRVPGVVVHRLLADPEHGNVRILHSHPRHCRARGNPRDVLQCLVSMNCRCEVFVAVSPQTRISCGNSSLRRFCVMRLLMYFEVLLLLCFRKYSLRCCQGCTHTRLHRNSYEQNVESAKLRLKRPGPPPSPPYLHFSSRHFFVPSRFETCPPKSRNQSAARMRSLFMAAKTSNLSRA